MLLFARVFSIAIWKASICPKLWHNGHAHTVHSLLHSGLKIWNGLACEARSATCMLSYLVNACDSVLTACHMGFTGLDRACAAKYILAEVLSNPQGVVLCSAKCLYVHCGSVFVTRMRNPMRMVARKFVMAELASQDSGTQHWLQSKSLNHFPMLLLGDAWEMPDDGGGSQWPIFSSSMYSVSWYGSMSCNVL